MIPSSDLFDQSVVTQLLDHDPVDYRAFFSLLDWAMVEQWQAQHSSRGNPLILKALTSRPSCKLVATLAQ